MGISGSPVRRTSAVWRSDCTPGRVNLCPPDPRTDQQLVQAANRGDAAAFEVLYLRYRDWTHRLAYRFTQSDDDALDVVQDSFAYLLRQFPGFELRARMTTFLYPVIKHSALARLRKRRGEVRSDEILAEIPAPPVGDEHAVRSDLAAVLAVLSAPQREVLLMRVVDEMTTSEIAEALEIPPGTVKSRLHKALTTLRADARTRRYFEP